MQEEALLEHQSGEGFICFTSQQEAIISGAEEYVLQTSPVKGLFDYWKSLPADQGLPLKSALDPLGMPPRVLPYLFLCELTFVPEFSVYFRLQGTFLSEVLGQNFTGKYLDETTFGKDASRVIGHYYRVATNRVPCVTQERISSGRGVSMIMEVIHLPLADEKGEPRYIIGALARIQDAVVPETPPENFVSRYWDIEMFSEIPASFKL
ncbi:PAS domain-containing protein [Kiloniella laminariae]|uniref:PAS domain-containing protein n=1 Tax=Kiloniella laminariae TaxID=454162 RepID=A0ABT4LFS5_9PROT|nr:PAS domain-containing protein [Kiloniella laminariae]MCZ4279939.1 PAS domain-containing protein [Kiloniella laminariae]